MAKKANLITIPDEVKEWSATWLTMMPKLYQSLTIWDNWRKPNSRSRIRRIVNGLDINLQNILKTNSKRKCEFECEV